MALTASVAGLVTLAACNREPPPTVQDYLDDKILRDAAMAHCSTNRNQTRYDPACVAVREASNRIAREEEAERRLLLEAESGRKRAALRRAQQAADEARRRAEEAERQRAESEYLALFETVDAGGDPPRDATTGSSGPGVALDLQNPVARDTDAPAPDDDGLDAIREELRRRNEGD